MNQLTKLIDAILKISVSRDTRNNRTLRHADRNSSGFIWTGGEKSGEIRTGESKIDEVYWSNLEHFNSMIE